MIDIHKKMTLRLAQQMNYLVFINYKHEELSVAKTTIHCYSSKSKKNLLS